MALIKPESTRRPPKRQIVQAKPGNEPNGSNTIDQHWDQQRAEIARNDELRKSGENTLSRVPDSSPNIVLDSVLDTDPFSQTATRSVPPQAKVPPHSTQSFDTVTVVVKEIEEDIDWKLLDKHERLKSRGKSGKLQNLHDPGTDIDSERQFVEVNDTPRGQVCCMINDINNHIHPNSVAAKYGISTLVLVRTLARFAQLKISETTPPGEVPELFD